MRRTSTDRRGIRKAVRLPIESRPCSASFSRNSWWQKSGLDGFEVSNTSRKASCSFVATDGPFRIAGLNSPLHQHLDDASGKGSSWEEKQSHSLESAGMVRGMPGSSEKVANLRSKP